MFSSDSQNQAFNTVYDIKDALFLYYTQWTKIISFTENHIGDHLRYLFCFQTNGVFDELHMDVSKSC